VAELERSGDDRSIVWGLMTLAALTFYGALFAESLNASSRAVARAQRSIPTQLPYCVVGMCRALVRAPSPTADEAARRCEEALSLTQADTIHAAIIENDLAFAEAISGRFGSARTRFDRIWRIFEQLAVDAFCQATLQDAGMCALLAGDFEDAEVTFRRCGELARSIDRLFSAEGAALHARALARLGRYTDALAEAENAARRSPNNDIEAQVWWRIAAALALSGLVDFRKAQTVARDAVVIARATQAPLLLGDALSAHGEVLLAEGRTAEAEATLQEAVAVYGAKGIAPAITATGELLERDAEMPAQR